MPRTKKPEPNPRDRAAAALLLARPDLTRAEIAKQIGSKNPKSLMNRAKYPLLAEVAAMNRAAKWDYHHARGETRLDRRHNGRPMPDMDGHFLKHRSGDDS